MDQVSLFKFELPTLYARAKGGAVLTWDIEVEGNKYRMITGQEGGAKVQSKWTVAQAKNIGQANETSAEQQAEAEATSKWKKKLKSGGYFEDVKDIDKPLAFIEPMLAHPLISKKTKKDKKTGKSITEVVDRSDKVRLPVMVDRKYNGMRQVSSSSGPFSRKGERINSAPHIYEALTPLFDKIPGLVLDGELYNHDYRHTLNELISIVRTTADHRITEELLSKSERIVRYYVYDGYGFEVDGVAITEDTPCRQRRDALVKLLKGVPYIVVVPYFMAATMEEAKKLYGGFVEDGYEGAILRNADSPYQHYRTDDLIKLKPYEDMEVIILDVIDPGSGNWGGTGKTARVRMDNGKEFTATFKGGRETLVKILQEKDKWIGQKVTMTFNGWTGLGTPNYGQIDPNNCMVGDR
jgi:DNA ligase-1